jgi:hypothetical protein
MKNLTVELTEEEARVALTMLEIALKATGDQAVDAYIVLRNKIRSAPETVVPEVTEVQDQNP